MSAIQSTAEPGTAKWIPEPLYQITIDQYESMVEAGTLTKWDRVHLINGYLVTKLPKNRPHVRACQKTQAQLDRILLDQSAWHTQTEAPVRLPPGSEPEPDVSVVRGHPDDYGPHHPGPTDIAMIAEVADSSVTKNRRMASVYAAANIPVYWVINLVDHQVEVFSQPVDGAYQHYMIYHAGEFVPVVIDGKPLGQIPPMDLLP